MIDKIKELLEKDKFIKFDNEEKSDEQLKDYIMWKAKKYLDGKPGAIEEDVVVGWAKHYYLEPNDEIYYFIELKQKEEERKNEQEESNKRTEELKKKAIESTNKKAAEKDDKKQAKGQTTLFDFV